MALRSLTAASLVFYAWWDWSNLPLLLLSVVVNFHCGQWLRMTTQSRQNVVLAGGLAFNLLLLGYFKYGTFIAGNLQLLSVPLDLPQIILPLAISFFTFQQIAYLVDSKKGDAGSGSFVEYLLFVSFFPQLIAGPIVHHRQIMSQFAAPVLADQKMLTQGLMVFSIGLFKKVMIADQFAVWANSGFGAATALSGLEAWLTSLSYTFQLYFDFSGYSDMAIGLALLFGIRLPQNFNAPYRASDIQDFWRRWHITLSQFLRDYLYIPLGGNRHGKSRMFAALLLTFLLGGLWHGASWMFVWWGALHGVALCLCRVWQGTGWVLPAPLAWLLTFVFVVVAWVFFRAPDLATATTILSQMFFPAATTSWAGQTVISVNYVLVFYIFAGFTLLRYGVSAIVYSEKLSMSRISGAAMLLLISLFGLLGHQADFLYFNF